MSDGVHILFIFKIRMGGEILQVAVAMPNFSVAIGAAVEHLSCTLICN